MRSRQAPRSVDGETWRCRSRTAAGCEGEAVVWDLRRQSPGVWPRASPHNEHGLLHSAGRHAQNRCHGHRGKRRLAAGGGADGRRPPRAGQTAQRRHAEPSTWCPPRSTCHVPERSGVTGVVNAELRAKVSQAFVIDLGVQNRRDEMGAPVRSNVDNAEDLGEYQPSRSHKINLDPDNLSPLEIDPARSIAANKKRAPTIKIGAL